jgi:beta-lactamase superfamily II metal-dependent hydrolase
MAGRKRRVGGDRLGLGVFALVLAGLCLLLSWLSLPGRTSTAEPTTPPPGSARSPRPPSPDPSAPNAPIAHANDTLRVHFYDVSQGLAALVDLPGGRRILVDTGDSPARERCGTDCATAHRHLLAALSHDLAGGPIDLLWITHQHSDHIGGARDVLGQFVVKHYVDNGRDANKAEVSRTHDAARARGTPVDYVSPSHPWSAPLAAAVAGPARLTPIVPVAWPSDCATDPNECSLALRIDFGDSSVLFTGDAERGEERALPVDAKVTLLQVAHHGSETSSGEAFLARVAPRYAVISAGHPSSGMNSDYCLPRSSTLEKLNQALGGGKEKTLLGFEGKSTCRRSHGAGWVAVPVNERLWATERDGDVVLSTHGDGVFQREGP